MSHQKPITRRKLDISSFARIIAHLSKPTSDEFTTARAVGFASVEEWRAERDAWSKDLRESESMRADFQRAYAEGVQPGSHSILLGPTIQEESPEPEKPEELIDLDITAEVKPRVASVLPFEESVPSKQVPQRRPTLRMRQATGTTDVPFGLGLNKPVTPFEPIPSPLASEDDEEITQFLPKKEPSR